MRKVIFVTGLMVWGVLSGCATTHTWPDYEQSAADKMTVIQTKIGDGLRTGALTADQSQMYLSRLKEIRRDDEDLTGKAVHREDWTSINSRLDALDADLTSSLNRTVRAPDVRYDDRIARIQKRIDEGRVNGRLTHNEQLQFQERLDTIRQDYEGMTDGRQTATLDDRTGISRRLDALETDVNRY